MVGVILIALLVYLVSNPAGGEVQPLVYNHKVHIENVGLECVDCHMNVEEGLPCRMIFPGILS